MSYIINFKNEHEISLTYITKNLQIYNTSISDKDKFVELLRNGLNDLHNILSSGHMQFNIDSNICTATIKGDTFNITYTLDLINKIDEQYNHVYEYITGKMMSISESNMEIIKDNVKLERQNEELSHECKELNRQLINIKKINEKLTNYNKDLQNTNEEFIDYNKKMSDDYNKIQNEYNEIQNEYNKLMVLYEKISYENETIENKNNIIEDLTNQNNKLSQLYENLKNKDEDKVKNTEYIENLQKIIKNKDQKISKYMNEILKLRQTLHDVSGGISHTNHNNEFNFGNLGMVSINQQRNNNSSEFIKFYFEKYTGVMRTYGNYIVNKNISNLELLYINNNQIFSLTPLLSCNNITKLNIQIANTVSVVEYTQIYEPINTCKNLKSFQLTVRKKHSCGNTQAPLNCNVKMTDLIFLRNLNKLQNVIIDFVDELINIDTIYTLPSLQLFLLTNYIRENNNKIEVHQNKFVHYNVHVKKLMSRIDLMNIVTFDVRRLDN